MKAPAALWKVNVAAALDGLPRTSAAWRPQVEVAVAKLRQKNLAGWSLEAVASAVALFAPEAPAALAWLACHTGQKPLAAYVLASGLELQQGSLTEGEGLSSLGVGCWVHLSDTLNDLREAARTAAELGAGQRWQLRAALVGCVPAAKSLWAPADDAALLHADPDDAVSRSFGVLAALRGRLGFDLRDGVDDVRPEAITKALRARAVPALRLLRAFDELSKLGAPGFRAIGEFADDAAAAKVLLAAKPKPAVLEGLNSLEKSQPRRTAALPLVRALLASWQPATHLGPLPFTVPKASKTWPDFIDPTLLARPRRDGIALDDEGLRAWVHGLQRARDAYPSWFDAARSTCEPGSLEAWVTSLVLQWLAAQCPPAHGWVLNAWCWLGFEAEITARAKHWASAGETVRAQLACRALTNSRLGLHELLALSVDPLLRTPAHTALSDAAARTGLSAAVLMDQLVPRQETPERKAREVARLERAMVDGRDFELAHLTEHLLMHPWLGSLITGLVFLTHGRERQALLLEAGPRWVTLQGQLCTLEFDQTVRLAHVLELTTDELRLVRARQPTQPIDQLRREVQPAPSAWQSAVATYEGVPLSASQRLALEQRGWVKVGSALARAFPNREARFTLELEDDHVVGVAFEGSSPVALAESMRELRQCL